MIAIKTLGDFHDFINSITKKYKQEYKGTLEEYLCSLLAVIDLYKDEIITSELLAQVIEEAFVTEPATIKSEWLENSIAFLGWEYREDLFYPKMLIDDGALVSEQGMTDYELLREVILFQIAELRALESTKDLLSWNVLSPSGNVWHNTDVFANLESGISGMIGHSDEKHKIVNCDWADLAILLETGRLYE